MKRFGNSFLLHLAISFLKNYPGKKVPRVNKAFIKHQDRQNISWNTIIFSRNLLRGTLRNYFANTDVNFVTNKTFLQDGSFIITDNKNSDFCSAANLLHIFGTRFPRNTSEWLLLFMEFPSQQTKLFKSCKNQTKKSYH